MKTFFFFGDSLTLGVNDPCSSGWVGQLCQLSGVAVPPATFYNLGARKNTSQAIARRWRQELEARLIPESIPKILFSFGVVDMAAPAGKQVLSLEESVEAARKLLVEAVEAYGKGNVIMLSPFPVVNLEHRERVGKLSAAYFDLCADFDIAYVDIFTHLSEHAPYLNTLSDGIHPDSDGNNIIADALREHEHMVVWLNS